MDKPHIKPLEDLDQELFARDPRAWFASQVQGTGLQWFLAHADDGVIWGYFDPHGTLRTSEKGFPDLGVKLEALTLQQARAFGPAGELFIWRSETGFAGRLILDGETPPADEAGYEEVQWLWGSAVEAKEKFARMQEGAEGLQHCPPQVGKGKQYGLKIRHYIDYDPVGQAFVSLSRLVELVNIQEGVK